MADLPTVDIKSVEILRTGSFDARDGKSTITPKILDQLVAAHKATEPGGLLNPPLKLGHDQVKGILKADGLPALGWIANLRRKGDTLVADLRKVPAKLADMLKAGGYRKRSVELRKDFEIDGTTYPWVLTAMALLGATLPAVEGLADIAKLYSAAGIDLDEDTVVLLLAGADDLEADLADLDRVVERIEARIRGRKGGPTLRKLYGTYRAAVTRVAAGKAGKHLAHEEGTHMADVEFGENLGNTIRRLIEQRVGEGGSIEDEMARVGRAAGISGSTVGQIVAGSITCPPINRLQGIARALGVSVRSLTTAAGRDGCSYDLSKLMEGHDVDLKTLIAKLGLAEDATEETVLAKLDERLAKLAELGKAPPDPGPKPSPDLEAKLSERDGRILKLETTIARNEAGVDVDLLIQAGKFLPAQRDTLVEFRLRDAKGFEAFAKAQPKVIDLGERGTSRTTDAELEPTATEKATAVQMFGRYDDEIRKRLIAEKARAAGRPVPATAQPEE